MAAKVHRIKYEAQKAMITRLRDAIFKSHIQVDFQRSETMGTLDDVPLRVGTVE
eukprot:m.317539 g.317539  ORF g.317539 m.317539 type:complete len:54 (+) comp16435_c0_seq3:1911-2072(+)